MKKQLRKLFSAARGCQWAGTLLSLSLTLLASAAAGQKLTEAPVWTKMHKAPLLPLADRYKTYSVEYDFGNMVVPVLTQPEIAGLELKKEGGELLLRIIDKGLKFSQGGVKYSKFLGRESFTYDVTYAAEYGYELLDRQKNTVIAKAKSTGGKMTTKSFTTQAELDGYMQSSFTADLARNFLEKAQKRADFMLAAHDWEVRLPLVSIAGDAPEYQDLNRATLAFATAIQGTAPAAESLRPLLAVWEAQLAKVDWENKKAPINKKVANALLTNVCGASLLLGDYAALREKTTLFDMHNSGTFGASTPTFEVEEAFSGPVYSTTSLQKDNEQRQYDVVQYTALARYSRPE
jgi:hypothetical protein